MEKIFLSFKWKVKFKTKHDSSFTDSDMKNKLFTSKKMIEVFWFGVSAIGKFRILEIFDTTGDE